MTSLDRRIATGLFVLTFVAYGYFFGGGGWNQNAQFDLTRAIVERHTFAIDAYCSNTGDISVHAGHCYANKAPGLSLIAAVPYALGLRTMWECTVAVCAASGALLIVLIFAFARRELDARNALLLALIFAFGTYIWAYSTVFFAHVPAAMLLFLAFAHRDRPIMSGAASALAVLCNYAALPAAVAIVVMFLVERRAGIGKLIAAAAPFALFLLAYQRVCFGSPFRTSVEATTPNFKTPGAFLGFLVAPRLAVMPAILISRYRGLFFLSPVLVFAFAGAVIMIRRRERLRELACAAAIFATFLLVNMAFNGWHGGSAIGPRYLLAAVPFLALPMMFAMRFMRPLWIVLAAVSIAFNFAVVAVNPLPSGTIADPLFRYTFPLLIDGRLPADTPPLPPYAWKFELGHVSVNQQTVDEIEEFEKHPLNSSAAQWASFNLAEIVAPGSVWSLLPIALWIAAGSALLIVQARRV